MEEAAKDYELPADCEENSDGSVTMPLRFPVSLTIKGAAGEIQDVLSALTIRRSTMDDMLAFETAKGASRLILAMLERLTGISPVAARKIDQIDAERFMGVVEGFTLPGQLDGSARQAI